jgi:hypothetical protein
MVKSATAILASIFCAGIAQASVQDASALPPAQTRGDISWVSGGIGQTQAKAFEHASSRYPLTLEFVVKPPKQARAEFTAAVPVTITGRNGRQLLSATSRGPFMLLELPEGRYTLSAQHRGTKIERHVVVGPGHRRVVFEWPG